jgi:FKBP-type peptidyl-prolyl cis-trans isomerase FkpA
MRLLCCVVLSAVLAGGCGGDDGGSAIPTAPSINVGFSTTDLQIGSGVEAVNGRLVTVNYTGWAYSTTAPDNKGNQFDTSLQPGRMPFPFVLGTGNAIQGFHRGVLGMRVGGRRRIVIPPELAYGNSPHSASIRANETLLFEVELLSVQ